VVTFYFPNSNLKTSMKSRRSKYICGQWLLGICVLGLASCDNKNQALFQQMNQNKALIEDLENRLKVQEAENKRVSEQLTAMAGTPTASRSSGESSPAGASLVLSEAVLKESLKKLAYDRQEELQKLLTSEGIELNGTSIPVVVVPKPYAAEVVLTLSKDGKAVPVPLTFHADWTGQWDVPDGAGLMDRIRDQLQRPKQSAVKNAPATPVAAPFKDLSANLGPVSNSKTIDIRTEKPVPTTAAVEPAPAATAPAEPAPIKRSIPMPAGVTNVKEIDIRTSK
jgi:hypothetical protein